MKERPILRNKLFLYFTEFFAGMSVMAVELGASRLLAPYFFLLTDSLDNCDWHDNDCDGARQSLRW